MFFGTVWNSKRTKKEEVVRHYTSAVDSGNNQREGMALLEYQAMPSLRNLAHDGWLCTFTYITEDVNSIRSIAGQLMSGQPVRYGKDRLYGHPSRTNHP